MTNIPARSLQHFLNLAGSYGLVEDGNFGPKSFAAARDYLADRRYPATWADDRTLIALQQLFLNATINAGLLVDGIAGAKFAAALAKYESVGSTPVRMVWPRQRDVPAFFGENPRTAPTAYVTPPYQLYADYARKPEHRVSRFMCHQLVKDPITRILNAAVEHYGAPKLRKLNLDIFSGCRVIRRITGGVGYSMHSWGIAIDWDAANNQFKDTWASGKMDGAEYKFWVDLWYAEGAINLGRERNYDPMHFQFARL